MMSNAQEEPRKTKCVMFQSGEDDVIHFDPTRMVSLQVDGCENTELSIVYYRKEVTDAW